jgi:multiple sugar transport system permease protein
MAERVDLVVPVTPTPVVPMASPRRRRRHIRVGYVFLVPAFLVLGIFMLGPSLYALYTAGTNMSLTGPGALNPTWIGTMNFRQAFQDPNFLNAVKVSLTYLVGSALIGQAGLGLLLALLMRGRSPVFKSILGGIVVAAWVIPDVVAGFLWSAFLHTDGFLNTLTALFGLPPHAWLQEYPMFSMLLFAAALESIPPELMEAAAIDGAGLWRRFISVTLPLMRTAIATDLLLITLATLSDFTLVWILTSGGPGFATQLMTIYTYQEAFKFYQLGYGTAVSLLILVVGAVLSLLYIRVLRVEL